MKSVRFMLLIPTMLLALLFLAGCNNGQAILIPQNTPVLLSQEVQATVAVKVDGKLVDAGKRRIPAGMWIVPYDWAFDNNVRDGPDR